MTETKATVTEGPWRKLYTQLSAIEALGKMNRRGEKILRWLRARAATLQPPTDREEE